MYKNKIRLIDVDSKIPNYALMKISYYYKKLGYDVDWYDPLFDFEDTDKIYASKIFTFTPDYQYYPSNVEIIKGGTGYDVKSKLPDEIENSDLDYSIYPGCDYSIVFTTRGCVRNCSFCLVREKEGYIYDCKIANLNPKGKWIMVLDNNFFANDSWKKRLEILRSYNQQIDFTQGIDIRTITKEQCEEIAKCKIKVIHTAWDNYKDKEKVLKGLNLITKYVKPYQITAYVLVGFENKEIVEKDIERVMTLHYMRVKPFAMGYIDFNNPNHQKTKSVKDFCRWVNHKAIFNTVTWEGYKK